jgi:alpha-galactosidase
MKQFTFTLFFLLIFTTVTHINAQKKASLAPTPPMGWNSWNWFGKEDINEKLIKDVIDAMVSEGLVEAGYKYIVVDGGWRDETLAPDGSLLSHPVKFPNGMKYLADYAHARGLKFGLHTVPGIFDCKGDPVGAYGREEVHIKQFVDWGLDFVKVDRCKMDTVTKEGHRGWTPELLQYTYRKWSELLAGCGSDIVFSISAYRFNEWYPAMCNMARTTGDMPARYTRGAIFDNNKRGGKLSVMKIADINNESAAFAGNGYWNDPDIMSLGEQGLNIAEQKSHFALWCVMSAPLMLGNDPRNMTAEEKKMITNKECIAVNQDPKEQGKRVIKENEKEVWVKNLSDGNKAVLLLNRGDETKTLSFGLSEIGVNKKVSVRDLFLKEDLKKIVAADGTITYELQPHAGLFMKISSK